MFIELAEHLRCPADHQEVFCVLAPEHMVDRSVVRGTVGCPVCRTEYPIADGVVEFGDHALLGVGDRADDVVRRTLPTAAAVQAFLSLDGPGGYLVLLGSAGRLAAELQELVEGVHFVGLNVPPDVHSSSTLSLLTAPNTIPLRDSMARGAVVPAEFDSNRWRNESVRVLRRGARLVVLGRVDAIDGARQLATAPGVWVGERV